MARQIGDWTYNDFPFNLAGSPHYNPDEPERTRFASKIISNEIRPVVRNGRPVDLNEVMVLRTRRSDGVQFLQSGWEPVNFTYSRTEAVEGLDFVIGPDGAKVDLTYADLEARRAAQPGPQAGTSRSFVPATVFAAPAATTAPAVAAPDELDAAFASTAPEAKKAK